MPRLAPLKKSPRVAAAAAPLDSFSSLAEAAQPEGGTCDVPSRKLQSDVRRSVKNELERKPLSQIKFHRKNDARERWRKLKLLAATAAAFAPGQRGIGGFEEEEEEEEDVSAEDLMKQAKAYTRRADLVRGVRDGAAAATWIFR